MQRALITGGAGFIGSNLADQLLAQGVEVVVLDDFRTGHREFLTHLSRSEGASLVEGDVLDLPKVLTALDGCDTVFHLQANADVRHGLKRPQLDLEQNALATSVVLEAMKATGVKRIALASSGSIYGEPDVFPTPEDCALPRQTSLYGASKMAAEGLVGAYCHAYEFSGVVLRFVSVLGERYTHGHIIDFYRSLLADGSRLAVLGDGRQRKSYLYVGDCVTGILAALDATKDHSFEVFNLGTEETITVDESAEVIARHMDVSPSVEHSGGPRGWPGDSPLIHLDCSKLRDLGWEPRLTIRESIVRTLTWLDSNRWVLGSLDR